MLPPGLNLHKKGEHVFNDIVGSFENSFQSAAKTSKAESLVLVKRYGQFDLRLLPKTTMSLNQLEKDSIVTQARSVVAPPSGIHNDLNSKIYGNARLRLETVLADLVFSTAAFLWKKKPRANSSFREFEAIVAGIKDVSLLKADACGAIDLLVDSAYDPQAESSALAERVSDTELTRRRAIIASMKRHLPVLKLTGRSLVTTFATELEQVLEGRIASA